MTHTPPQRPDPRSPRPTDPRRTSSAAASPARRRRRWITLLAGAAACLALTGCQAPLPEVTFYGDRSTVDTAPTRWCTVDTTAEQVNCTEADTDQVQRLSLRAGQPVQINVPGQVGHQPWGVYFRYRDAGGQLLDGRSEVFTDGRLAYTLRPFNAGDQLVYVEVQSGFVLMAGTDNGVDFAASQGWLLLIDPVEPAPAAAA